MHISVRDDVVENESGSGLITRVPRGRLSRFEYNTGTVETNMWPDNV